MGDNVLSEIRQLLQDVIAPDVKALSMRMEGVEKRMELFQRAVEAQLDSFRAEQAAFRTEISAFRAEMRSEFQAQRNLLQVEVLRETSPIRERVASLESRNA